MEQLDFRKASAFFVQIDQQIFLVKLEAFFIYEYLIMVAHYATFGLMNIDWLQMHVWLAYVAFSLLEIVVLVFLFIADGELLIKALPKDLASSVLKICELVVKVGEGVVSEGHPRVDAAVKYINLKNRRDGGHKLI